MATKRTYGDGCAIAHGLDLVGERWALLVVRELLLGPKRFTDLKRGLPNASPNVISERLRQLEQAGVVRRDKLPPPASSRVYELTEWGRGLEDVVVSLGHWASRSPSRLPDAPIGADSTVLALRSRFDPDAAEGLQARYELRLGEDRFRAEIAGGRFGIVRGSARAPDATIESDPATLATVLWHGRRLRDAQRAGRITITGSEEAAERFLAMFPLPAGAAATAPV